ncbi:hypothetical protein yc1106_03656 [Curvularia clavata]|uniref:Uncharacterized protein n=1 Tax=Curvularia clavata TaxID=95742 RepID=A0A9Q8Z663_CURCL|nr:hypothetical protein yc1106_03656 [Curvularia clavata]
MDGLRLADADKLQVEGTGGQPMNAVDVPYRVFLLGDSEVLVGSDYETGLIKVVTAEYHAATSVPDNWKCGAHRYFGWIRMPAQCIRDRWLELEMIDSEDIVNSSAGGPGALLNSS